MKASCSTGSLSASAVPKTFLAIFATSARRPKLLQVIIGCSAASPTDTQALFAIRKITVAGTGTAATPFPADPADGAPVITVVINHTAEPTYQAGDPIEIGLHNRNTAIWQPPTPDAALSTNLAGGTVIGIGIQMVSGPTGLNYNVTAVWDE